ncbi:alpha-amylase family protein [Kineosporia babensis]|uniref:Uncharacterized protein n=1 Tax=Kineosporia babensis TaxID=499548 RepID=A0A9X1SV17_9ACTN|nr:hypothetical protein [Kineosporia babensis]MCD5313121.1 hypothetical protein [Kineosporia babensis]
MAEAVEGPRRNLYARPDELGQAFVFDLMELGWNAADWHRITSSCLAEAEAAGTTCTWTLSNHDVVRHDTRFGLPDGTDLDAWRFSAGRSPRPLPGVRPRRGLAAAAL